MTSMNTHINKIRTQGCDPFHTPANRKLLNLQLIGQSPRLQPAMSNNDKRFVLCVDDDLDDRMVICEAIKDADPSLDIVQAQNGLEANQFLQQAKATGHFPCLVILDINMPLMDGKEALKEIKKDEILKTLPVVFFSTSSNPRDRSFSTEYGVEFVTKPANYHSIVTTIKELIARCGP